MTTINLPSTFTADILGQATAFLAQLSPFLTLIIGVLLAVVVVEILIGIFRK